ncbi:hypothetical protein EJB05_32575, partial [Eragrostis curvula]
MSNEMHEQTTGCLPVDQSCLALSRLSKSHRATDPHACCSTASFLEVLGISFASLLVVLSVLCAIRCYLVRRAGSLVVTTHAAGVERRPAGLGDDAIAALPVFEYRATGENWECAICINAVADGEVVRKLPRCMHLFHRGCVDMWLTEHTTCPVCRDEVMEPVDDAKCAERPDVENGSETTEREPARLENGERDLEAQ